MQGSNLGVLTPSLVLFLLCYCDLKQKQREKINKDDSEQGHDRKKRK